MKRLFETLAVVAVSFGAAALMALGEPGKAFLGMIDAARPAANSAGPPTPAASLR